MTTRVIHFLSGLAVGGKERAALRLAQRGIREGQDHRLLLFDTPFRHRDVDFEPAEVPVTFMPRTVGVDLAFAWRVRRYLHDVAANVVHAYNDTALFYAVLAGALRRKPKIVATFHTWPSHPTAGARVLTRIAAKGVQHIVACEQELADRLTAAKWVPSCDVIANGVDLHDFRPDGPSAPLRTELGLSPDCVLIGHVARFDAVKCHDDLLAAAGILRSAALNVAFVLVGQGPRLEDIRRQAQGLGNVHFLPQVHDMPRFYRALDVAVLCSVREAMPFALLEAMACSIPVVATAVGGIPQLVDTDERAAGLLVAPRNPECLAMAIAAIALDPAARARFARAARNRAAAFSFDAEWAAYARLYGAAGAGSSL